MLDNFHCSIFKFADPFLYHLHSDRVHPVIFFTSDIVFFSSVIFNWFLFLFSIFLLRIYIISFISNVFTLTLCSIDIITALRFLSDSSILRLAFFSPWELALFSWLYVSICWKILSCILDITNVNIMYCRPWVLLYVTEELLMFCVLVRNRLGYVQTISSIPLSVGYISTKTHTHKHTHTHTNAYLSLDFGNCYKSQQ